MAVNKLIDEATADQFKILLEGKLSEELRPKDLAELAKAILMKVASTSSKSEVEN